MPKGLPHLLRLGILGLGWSQRLQASNWPLFGQFPEALGTAAASSILETWKMHRLPQGLWGHLPVVRTQHRQLSPKTSLLVSETSHP